LKTIKRYFGAIANIRQTSKLNHLSV